MSDPSFADALSDSEVRIWINACNHEPARQALRQLLAYRIRGVSVPLADPIPEAPADEEVEGLSLEKAVRDAHKTLMNTLDRDFGLWSSPAFAKAREAVYPLWKRLDETLAALRRSTKTDKPGVREAALEEAAKVADMFAADHAKSADQFGIDRNRELHNAAKGAAQGVAFAIRALSASPLTEEQPVAPAHQEKNNAG